MINEEMIEVYRHMHDVGGNIIIEYVAYSYALMTEYFDKSRVK